MTPFPFQVRCIDRVRDEVRKGSRAPLIVAPTGAGKTCIGAIIAASHIAKSPDNRVVWLAHRRELLTQTRDTFARLGVTVGCIGLNLDARVQVCSTQTLLARGEVPPATLVIYDEAHHYAEAAEDWSRLGVVYKEAIRIGLTATPERGDGAGLSPLFDSIVVAASVRELVDIGRLVPCTVYRPGRSMGAKYLALSPVEAYQRYTPRGRAVVFAPNVVSCESFAAEFLARGVRAVVVHGQLDMATRDARLADFASGRASVVVNVNVLTEGWDCPAADTCILARKIGTPGLAIQMWGRVMRACEGKTGANVIDLTGVTMTHGSPGDEREYFLEGDGIRLAGRAPDAGERKCKVCGTPLGDSLTCAECGTDHEMVVPTAVGEELQKFDWRSLLAQDPPDKRAARLARWIAEGRAKGYKENWARVRFKIVYGSSPDPSVWRKACG